MTSRSPTDDTIRNMVREGYGKVARGSTGCCGGAPPAGAAEMSERLGYSKDELAAVPDGANLGLGCGNPTAIAALRPGEVVVDLGSGPGLDALLAAAQVGPEGRVIGVDMTPDMLERARKNAVRQGVARNVEFREGIIEALPLVAESADVILSNCVVNLSPDKAQVFREAFRVLRPGGRLAISDIVLTAPLPSDIASAAEAYVGCVSGAMLADDYLATIRDAGFVDVEYDRVNAWPLLEGALSDPMVAASIEQLGVERLQALHDTIWSYKIRARKPART